MWGARTTPITKLVLVAAQTALHGSCFAFFVPWGWCLEGCWAEQQLKFISEVAKGLFLKGKVVQACATPGPACARLLGTSSGSVYSLNPWCCKSSLPCLGKVTWRCRHRDFDIEKCWDDSISWKRNFQSWRGVGALGLLKTERTTNSCSENKNKQKSYHNLSRSAPTISILPNACTCYAKKPQRIAQSGKRTVSSGIYKGPEGPRKL